MRARAPPATNHATPDVLSLITDHEETMTKPDSTQPPPPEGLVIIDFEMLTKVINVKKDGESISLDAHLSEKIKEAVAAARYHNKEAQVTLVLRFKPSSGNQMDVFPDVTSKVPTEKPSPIPLFAKKEGDLYVEDPDQRPLPKTAQFRTVRDDEPPKEPKK